MNKIKHLISFFLLIPAATTVLAEGLPETGEFILDDIGRLALAKSWHVDELQVERGQLDEVFRLITPDRGERS